MGLDEKKEGTPTEQKTGLEFEFSPNGYTFAEKPEEKAVEEPKVEEPESSEPEKAEEPEENPDAIDSQANFEAELRPDKPSIRVGSTYVPRFTEASEKHSLLSNQEIYKKYEASKKATTSAVVAEKATEQTPTVSATKVETTDKQPDPTSDEVEKCKVDKVVIAQPKPKTNEIKEEGCTIYKFNSNEPKKEKTENYDGAKKAVDDAVKDALNKKEENTVEEPIESEPLKIEEEVEEIPRKTENDFDIPDPDDGYRIVDYQKADENSDRLSSEEAPKERMQGENDVFGSAKEFTKPGDKESFKDRFLDTLMSVKIRLAAAIVLVLGMATVDILNWFNIKVTDHIGLANVPGAGVILDFMCVCCLLMLASPELFRMLKYLIHGFVLPEITLLASFLVLIIYTALVSYSGVADYPTLGIIFGAQAIGAIYANLLRTKSDYEGFLIISKNGVKKILDKRHTRKLQRENLALDGLIDEYSSKTARMFRASNITDFFSRTSRTRENTVGNVILLTTNLGISLVLGFVMFFLKDFSAPHFALAFALTFMLGAPLISILLHKVPFKRAEDEAKEEQSTFVGEDSIYAFSDVDVVAYEDTEIFGAEDISLKKVHLYGKVSNSEKAMKEMYSIFSAVGGPLETLFANSLDKKCEQATDIIIEEDGISGVFQEHRICCGTESYMKRHKIIIPDDDYRNKPSATDSTRVMYGAEDGFVYVKFFIRYSFSEEFTMTLPLLKQESIIPLIYTKDPNISLELIKVLTTGEDVIRIMKKNTLKVKDDEIYRSVSAGIVTLGNKDNAINMLLLSKKYTKFQKKISIIEKISMGVGIVLSAVLTALGITKLPIALMVLLPVAFCIYLQIRTRVKFNINKKTKD